MLCHTEHGLNIKMLQLVQCIICFGKNQEINHLWTQVCCALEKLIAFNVSLDPCLCLLNDELWSNGQTDPLFGLYYSKEENTQNTQDTVDS